MLSVSVNIGRSTEIFTESPKALAGINKINMIEKYGMILHFIDISVS
jgi:hypothetical protein